MLFSALVGLLARKRIGWLLGLALGLVPAAARAWTEAHVREADVALKLLAGGAQSEVELDLLLEVRGGWLEQIELPGLDEGGLTLAEDAPAVALLESGEEVPAQVSRRGATLVLKFARRDGLRRGMHHLRLRYVLAAGPEVEGAEPRLSWTLPGFEAGLRRAAIRVSGPAGMRALQASDQAQATAASEGVRQQALMFTRVHVPRATPWTIAVALPRQGRAAPVARVSAAGGQGLGADLTTGGLLAFASLALVGLMRWTQQLALRREGLSARGLGLARPLSLLWLTALSAIGGLCFAGAPAVSIAAWSALFVLGVPQAERTPSRLALGKFRPLTRLEHARLRRARRLAWLGMPWLDALSALGAVGSLGLTAFVLRASGAAPLGREPWGVLALCSLLGLLVSARALRPRAFAERVELLVRAARRARTLGCALGLVVYESEGRLSQPRLRIVPEARFPGLLRLEVLVDSRRGARPLLLSALVEAESPASRWLSALFPRALRESGEGGRRLALLQPIDDIGATCELVLDQLSRESQRSLLAASAPANAA